MACFYPAGEHSHRPYSIRTASRRAGCRGGGSQSGFCSAQRADFGSIGSPPDDLGVAGIRVLVLVVEAKDRDTTSIRETYPAAVALWSAVRR